MRSWRFSVLAILVLSLIVGAFSPPPAAQFVGNCPITASGFFSPLPWARCTYAGTFGASDYVCTWPGNCASPAAANETYCAACAAAAGRPIALGNGDTYIVENDVRVPGLGGGLSLTRIWNSIWPPTQTSSEVGLFGPNWRSTYEERVFLGNDLYMKYARGDGSFWSFYNSGRLGCTHSRVLLRNSKSK